VVKSVVIRHRRQALSILVGLARVSLWPILALVTLPTLYFVALAAAGPLFELRTPLTPVDVIVVLGGDGLSRAARAAAVYRSIASVGPRVLISGIGDCRDIAKLMSERGVPSQRISVECLSQNTWENAKYSGLRLQEMGARSAILVTSWFHMRRAIACFEAFSPQIRWLAAPVERRRPLFRIAWDNEGFEVAKEYLKIAWYAARYGVAARLVRPMLSGR
jgi:uncharacterized SAM-binding protein YcdF (DUF218 family)